VAAGDPGPGLVIQPFLAADRRKARCRPKHVPSKAVLVETSTALRRFRPQVLARLMRRRFEKKGFRLRQSDLGLKTVMLSELCDQIRRFPSKQLPRLPPIFLTECSDPGWHDNQWGRCRRGDLGRPDTGAAVASLPPPMSRREWCAIRLIARFPAV